MSEAPERIWADGKDYWANPTFKDDKTEYVRVDMLHEIFLRYSKTETARIEELESNIRELFVLLERVEETDEGRRFHPVQITCCRALDMVKLERVLRKLKGEKDD